MSEPKATYNSTNIRKPKTVSNQKKKLQNQKWYQIKQVLAS